MLLPFKIISGYILAAKFESHHRETVQMMSPYIILSAMNISIAKMDDRDPENE